MRPHGHPTRGAASEDTESREKLHDVPQTQQDHGGHGQREYENQCKNSRARVKQDVSAHYAGDRSARAHGWNIGVKIKDHVKEPRPDPADQIEEEIRDVAKEIFDVVAKDPEKEHVPSDMQPAGVQKHAGDQGKERNFESRVSSQKGRESGRHRGVRKKEGIKGVR